MGRCAGTASAGAVLFALTGVMQTEVDGARGLGLLILYIIIAILPGEHHDRAMVLSAAVNVLLPLLGFSAPRCCDFAPLNLPF
jgi:hypothetical protein